MEKTISKLGWYDNSNELLGIFRNFSRELGNITPWIHVSKPEIEYVATSTFNELNFWNLGPEPVV